MNTRSDIRLWRVYIFALSIRRAADDDVAAFFSGARFDPVNVFAVEHHLTESDRPLNDQVCCDW
ncbi:MAG TPA: hypothetical protein VFD58_36550 [Blastocatellia bacterium]|nr:hypothetical protein [Blastocatellia bacterium]